MRVLVPRHAPGFDRHSRTLPLVGRPDRACLLAGVAAADQGHRAMEVFIQQLINGITLGSIYGLIAIGYTMVFGIIGMVNFAHGDVFMVSAFIALIPFLLLTGWLGIASPLVALLIVLVLAMALTALWGW